MIDQSRERRIINDDSSNSDRKKIRIGNNQES
jgi:hypothetical protein